MAETPVTPIAVIGMACRLPNGIDSPAKLWDALLRGDDLVTEVPLDRWDAEEFYDPEIEKRQGKVARERGFDVREHALYLYADCTKPRCPNRKKPSES